MCQAQQFDEQLFQRSKVQNATFDGDDDNWWERDDEFGPPIIIIPIFRTQSHTGDSFAGMMPPEEQFKHINTLLAPRDAHKSGEARRCFQEHS